MKNIFSLLALSFFLFSCKKETIQENANPPVVNAGNNQTIQLPASSFTLTGSATTENGSIVGYLWSLVSGPNVPVITSPSSATTTVTNLVSGTYIFQLMAIDNVGLTGVDTTKVTVNPSPIQTLTLQPANNTGNEVLFALLGGTTPQTDPLPPELVGGAWTNGGNLYLLRAAFRFDLSSIPSTATILTAKLTLYSNPTPLNGDLINANSGPNNSLFLSRITASWTASTVNWFTQPPVSPADQISIPHTSQSFLDLVDIDVKNQVAAMVAGNNYGFMIRLQNEVIYNIRNFCSSRYSNAAKHPKLVITYQ